jgi:NAD(P)-dependent dehydrogenase (short-subunit alcohol dehydrogenase family)
MSSMNISQLFGISGKTAIVTGGSRGIGYMIAQGYVENGVKVYITARKADDCERAAAQLSEQGECTSIPVDLSTTEGRAAFVGEIRERESSLDILVNNAGAAWGAAFEDYPESGYNKQFDTNVKAPFMLTRDLLPLLKAAGSSADPARVINIGSIDDLRIPDAENYAYGPTKAAVHHMTRVLAVRLASDQVTVNAIAPGPFESKMMAFTLGQKRDQIEEECPLKRIGKPTDIAGIAIYLASPAASYVTSTVTAVDGGICIA